MHEQLKEVLIGTASAGKRFVVFIDEAQNLRRVGARNRSAAFGL